MVSIVILTSATESPLPALGLLPHQIALAPMAPQSLAEHNASDLVIIDAVTDLVAAKNMASLLKTAKLPVPVMLAIGESSLAVLDASWGIADFLLNSSSLAEMEARIRLAITAAAPQSTSGLSHSGITIDESSYQAAVTGRALDLTFKEFELLRFLVANPSRVFTREQLLSEVWGYDYFGGTRTVDVHIRRLRAKLGDHESVIGTVRNVGYRFAPGNSRGDE
ncbi:DNA-binding response OmpR family regulator [Microbacteriaceae bacterium MWH-Ta3]|nr:DNA-binding response OmpR family regulator [Microbacteriaceae bacterium MWH-Ta3]